MGLISKITALVTAVTMMTGINGKDNFTIVNKGFQEATGVSDSKVLTAPVDPVRLYENITIGWNIGNSLDALGWGIGSETSWGNPVVAK